MKTKLLTMMLLAGGTMFAGSRVSIGVNIGGGPGYYGGGYYGPGYVMPPPPPVPAYGYYAPPAPGPGFTYVSGYWYPVGRNYKWRQGYWTRPPRGRGRWVAPYYNGGRYYNGYWR